MEIRFHFRNPIVVFFFQADEARRLLVTFLQENPHHVGAPRGLFVAAICFGAGIGFFNNKLDGNAVAP